MSVAASEETFVVVAKLGDLEDGIGRCVQVEGKTLALFRVGSRVYALDDRCPHQDASLAEGDLEDEVLMCPLHGWTFDVTTGRVLNGEKDVQVYEVRVDGEDVLVATP